MAMITINNKTYHVAPEVADLLRTVSEERDFYRKVLEAIAYEHLVYRSVGHEDRETLNRFRRLAHETLSVYN
jgi:hypothetical protein